jgi:hypothetical protein
MAPLGPPKVMKVRSGGSPRLKPGVKTAPLTPGFSPGLLGVTSTGAATRFPVAGAGAQKGTAPEPKPGRQWGIDH